MRHKFILVGLVLGVFVFPYVLNIEEGEAAGLGCPNSLSTNVRIQCLQNKARQLLALNEGLQQRATAIESTLHICEDDLNRYDEKWDTRDKSCGDHFEGAQEELQDLRESHGQLTGSFNNLLKCNEVEGKIKGLRAELDSQLKYLNGNLNTIFHNASRAVDRKELNTTATQALHVKPDVDSGIKTLYELIKRLP